MPDALRAISAGALLGMLFYGGLWLTVRRAAIFRRPVLAVLGSTLLRIGAALGGFYLVADGQWLRMLFCLLGFLMARLAVTWATYWPSRGARHAP